MKLNKNSKKSWIQNGIFILVAILLYVTGLHTEVIGFVQRGVLATGLMNPGLEKVTPIKNSKTLNNPKADLNLKIIDADGNITSLSALKGKVIFLNYWATWCPPCIAEMPNIVKLHKHLGNEVAFVMLSFDKDFEKAKNFNAKKGYELPIYAPASKIPAIIASSSLPTTYIIDKDGNLAFTHKGMANYNSSEFKKFLKSLDN